MKALRIAVAVVLLSALAYSVDWQTLPTYFTRLDWRYALLAFVGLNVQFVVSPWKWRAALRLHELEFNLAYLIRVNGVGFFFNNFLPSGIGGDVYRVMGTWPSEGRGSRAVSGVIIERVVGFATLVGLGALGAIALLTQSALARTYLVVCVVLGFLALAGVLALLVGSEQRWVERFRHTRAIQAILFNIGYLRAAHWRWLPFVGLSLLFQVIAVANIYALFRSFGIDASWPACALIAAISGIATVVPLSINGLGIVEGSFAGAALALGIDYEAAFAIAVLIRIMVFPASIVFGLVYAFSGASLLRRQQAGMAAKQAAV